MQEEIKKNREITANSEQIDVLKAHFPQCFDKEGRFRADKLEDIVRASGVDVTREGYKLDWLGKSYARLLANLRTETLLAPNTAHNSKPENANSENLLIQGDNLDVLKHLVNAYSEKVKIIYIDPPYNTGSDGFVYSDNRKFTPEALSKLAGVDEDEAKRILDFTQSKSNSHSAWLTFMYPRLYVARELLREDGIIFISIDDNEQAQLKILCDEVFGEENFLTSISVKMSEATGVKMAHADSRFPKTKETIHCYSKQGKVEINPIRIKLESWNDEYKEILLDVDEESISEAKRVILDEKGGAAEISRLNFLMQDARIQSLSKYFSDHDVHDEQQKNEFKWSNAHRIVQAVGAGSLKVEAQKTKSLGQDVAAVSSARGTLSLIKTSFNNQTKDPRIRLLFADKYLTYNPGDFWTDVKTSGGVALEGNMHFPQGKKPLKLIKRIIECSTHKDSDQIILDFFAGSGTTAHAVMDVNAKTDGKRRYILAQSDEPADIDSDAYKDGYHTIFEITRERILRSANQLKEEYPNASCDFGFKEFKTIPANKGQFKGYLDDAETLQDYEPFNGMILDGEAIEALLTTWKAYDGVPLHKDLKPVDLGGYIAHMADDILYFADVGLHISHITAMLSRIDEDETFSPRKIVIFHHRFNDKQLREFSEAVNAPNRKHLQLEFIQRF